MKIRMNLNSGLNEYSELLEEGKVYDVDDRVARDWVRRGVATPVEVPVEAIPLEAEVKAEVKAVASAEAAVAEGEQAVGLPPTEQANDKPARKEAKEVKSKGDA